ncbi:protein of unknown function [Azospirillum baldaniorum]|uniref:Uncharacterized protein n=1 Tax=Azospirillum baldaniorum TaxID=1064539 RepID=A0A9P1JT88_9PROT|nr:protein of unknown function [Azospirillum baldaniorum]
MARRRQSPPCSSSNFTMEPQHPITYNDMHNKNAYLEEISLIIPPTKSQIIPD